MRTAMTLVFLLLPTAAMACQYEGGCLGGYGGEPATSAPHSYSNQDYSFTREVDRWYAPVPPPQSHDPYYAPYPRSEPPSLLEMYERPYNDPFRRY